ncbi:SDR family oxidoreductase [Streptomyces shenzhenensis]|uniref:Dehydrogenase n=1 Tax=Streptomyces shenzhenensis TaxID=943815 RepID=A0A3M0I8S5_9ACTN|nr:SDR family oxidoreductase [Streptomyces shenzhenensis]RMB85174.1 dehydrogenase [Streptomyces shenzhenensis]
MSIVSPLAGKHVVVIGGTSGIGLAIAEHALAAGARVTAASRNPGRTAGTVPSGIATEQADITSAASIESLLERVGTFDHLAISAGTTALGTVRELDSGAARAFMDTKFWGAYEGVRAAADRIAKDGSIVLIGGIASRKHGPGRPTMAAINAALEAFGKANAVDLAPVRVNVIAPGLVETPAFADVPEDVRRRLMTQYVASVPVARVGLPEDIASAAVFLMSNGYATGSVVDVDGGVQLT